MKKVFALSLLLVALGATTAFAQTDAGAAGPGPTRQGRGGQGGFRAGFGAQNMSPARLVFRSDVRADLGLTDDQKTKLDALRTSLRGQRGQNGGTPPTPEEMRARREEQQKQIEAILTPDQTKRLGEIAIQLEGDMAVASPKVQKELGFTSDQTTKLKDLQEKFREAMQSVRDKSQSGELDRQASRDAMTKNVQALKDEIHKILTPAQVDQLKALGGKPFQADPNENFGGFGGRGGRGGRRGGG